MYIYIYYTSLIEMLRLALKAIALCFTKIDYTNPNVQIGAFII